jgi:hypothetical protein
MDQAPVQRKGLPMYGCARRTNSQLHLCECAWRMDLAIPSEQFSLHGDHEYVKQVLGKRLSRWLCITIRRRSSSEFCLGKDAVPGSRGDGRSYELAAGALL